MTSDFNIQNSKPFPENKNTLTGIRNKLPVPKIHSLEDVVFMIDWNSVGDSD
jgi:hypothetical protein